MSLTINKSQIFSEFFTKVQGERKVNFIVLHHIEVPSLFEAIKALKVNKVSAHFVIDDEGNIFQLVEENNIAYHAGVSYWNGIDGINSTSIGIEFLNKNVSKNKFSFKQLQSGLMLCQYLINKYKVKPKNIVAHSDIAYYKDAEEKSGFLDRKQDPSHLFDWKFLSDNGVAIYHNIQLLSPDPIIFRMGDKGSKLINIKNDLAKIGYKITNINDEFDLEMKLLTRVFHRRFNQRKFLELKQDCWFESSGKILQELLKKWH